MNPLPSCIQMACSLRSVQSVSTGELVLRCRVARVAVLFAGGKMVAAATSPFHYRPVLQHYLVSRRVPRVTACPCPQAQCANLQRR